MAQQGGTEGFSRDRALEALVTLSINDPHFLKSLRGNIESTLWNHGFALSPDEIKTARNFLNEAAQESDQQIIDYLKNPVGSERRW